MASVMFAVVTFLLIAVCAAVPTKKEIGCSDISTADYNPVCDVNGRLFSNLNAARCAGLSDSEVSILNCDPEDLIAGYSSDDSPDDEFEDIDDSEDIAALFDPDYKNIDKRRAGIAHGRKNPKAQAKKIQLKRESPPDVLLCGCPHVMHKVCGVDNEDTFITFNNDCLMKCVDATLVHDGACTSEELGLPEIFSTGDVFDAFEDPDKRAKIAQAKTFAKNTLSKLTKKNEQMSGTKKERSLMKTDKKQTCSCIRKYEPVCANNGIDYNNEDCATKCGGAERVVDGTCEDVCPDCKSDRSYKPVCDNSGVLYRNSCVAAQCFDVEYYEEATDGLCVTKHKSKQYAAAILARHF